jgi:excisionase family DNA binding protein
MTKYITVEEAAPTLGLTQKALRQRIFRGQFPYKKLGRRVLISTAELEKFLDAIPEQTAQQAVETVEEI